MNWRKISVVLCLAFAGCATSGDSSAGAAAPAVAPKAETVTVVAPPSGALVLSYDKVSAQGGVAELAIPQQVLVEELRKRVGAQAHGETPVLLALDAQLGREEFSFSSAAEGVKISASGTRGALFGVGYLLRHLHWAPGQAWVENGLKVKESPKYPIRGHQLGYRAQANSYDAWTPEIFDQYIREMAFFGTNCVENIPFQDERPTPIMPLSRPEMNRKMSEICAKYDVDYWVWTPADFDLKDAAKREAALKFHEQFYQDCPRLDAIFFPGGDPGDNHPREVLPFLEDLSKILPKYHPNAKIWMSLQGFEGEKEEYFFAWIKKHQPEWLGGVVGGPGSLPLNVLRERLDARYPIRDYPDITHVVRCQYPELNLDQVFALTAGREAINPRPLFYAEIFKQTAPYTAGFLSYSDGCHDDVNKALWSQLAWNPEQTPKAILTEYSRCFFGEAAETAAEGILALEQNWNGSLRDNAGVPETLALWQKLEGEHPELRNDWRWQMLLTRAYYDGYQRERLAYETALEQEAYEQIKEQADALPTEAMAKAEAVLQRAVTTPVRPDLRDRLVVFFDQLYDEVRFQSSVERYHAIHPQRACMLDFMDYPLNNRFWLEDEFHKVATLPTLEARWARLQELRAWEKPGEGSFYDDIGHVGRSPHVMRGEALNENDSSFWWWDNGISRLRLSWIVTGEPKGLAYTGLDPSASYLLRFSGFGELKPLADGKPLAATLYNTDAHTMKEFPVPQELTADGTLEVTFGNVYLEGVNWRNQPRLAEAWLLKNVTPTAAQQVKAPMRAGRPPTAQLNTPAGAEK